MTKTHDALQTLWNAIPENAIGQAEDDAHAILREFIGTMLAEYEPKRVDVAMLRETIEALVFTDRLDHSEIRDLPAQFAMDTSGAIETALGWECSSCRPDVGWAESPYVVIQATGDANIHVECGHCGAEYNYDLDGNEKED